MLSLSTATCLLLLLSGQAPAEQPTTPATPSALEPLEVRHVPRAQALAGRPLVLEAEVAPAWRLGALVAHYRAAGETEYREVPFELSAEGPYVATLPVPDWQRVPVEYYLTARDREGVESVRFASAETPHPVLLEVPPALLEVDLLLERYRQRRSRVRLAAEYVDYGSLELEGTRYADSYYRVEADYLYRLLTFTGALRLDSIRIGVGSLRANTPPFPMPGQSTPTAQRQGLDYGFSEVEATISPGFGLAARLLLGGNASGFALGVGGRIRIGRPYGSHAEIEAETTAGLGSAATLRLAWDTVPRFPMSAAVQVTNVPSGPFGVRLLYTVDHELAEGFMLSAQVGFQARSAVGGGPTLGLGASYGW
jgi:hypothetical protein